MSKIPNISGKQCIKALAKGTLRSIIKSIGLTVDQFIELL